MLGVVVGMRIVDFGDGNSQSYVVVEECPESQSHCRLKSRHEDL